MKKILGLIIMSILLTLLISCEKDNKFDLIWRANLPDECNMTLNILSTYKELQKDTTVKDFTFINISATPCWSALKSIRCRYEAFGIDSKTNKVLHIDSTKSIRYQAYLQCLNRQ